MAAAAEQLGAHLLIELLGVEHQAVEVEDDGAGSGHEAFVSARKNAIAGTKLGPGLVMVPVL